MIPPINQYASRLSPSGSPGSANTFSPSLASDILTCIPDPFTPYLGFGMKLAKRPWRFAIVFMASLKVMMLSAVFSASS